MPEKLCWGLIGPGMIAHKFATGFRAVEGASLCAVASRSLEKAQNFAGQYRIPKAYGSYEALLADSEVDAVYICLPNTLHKPWTLAALEAGKHVLCEKPFAINRLEAEAMVAKAQESGCFLMDALWTRFLPGFRELEKRVAQGQLGRLRSVHAEFGIAGNPDPQWRLFNRDLGGGSLLDIGCYCLLPILRFLGSPEEAKAFAHIGPSGVDEHFRAVFNWQDGRTAHFHTSIAFPTTIEAHIHGTEQKASIGFPFYKPVPITFAEDGEAVEVVEEPYTGNGYNYQLEEANRCIREGKQESPLMPWSFTLEYIDLMDALRHQVELTYPAHDTP